MIRFHHAHLLCSDIDATIAFFSRWFGGRVAGDIVFAGARNVFLSTAAGRLHLSDHPPRTIERSPIHHPGIQTDNLDDLVAKMTAGGITFRKPITDDPLGRYIMVEGPDRVLLELFEMNPDTVPEHLR